PTWERRRLSDQARNSFHQVCHSGLFKICTDIESWDLLTSMLHEVHCGARPTLQDPKLRSPLAAAGLSPASAPRARPVPSALHHAFAFSRTRISAAMRRRTTTVRALGAATSAGAREGEARRCEAGSHGSPGA